MLYNKNVFLLLNGADYPVTTNVEKIWVTQCLYSGLRDPGAQIPLFNKGGWGRTELPVAYDNRLRSYLRDPYKTVEPDRLHLSTLRTFSGVLARSLSILFEKLWKSMEVLDNWKKANVVPVFKEYQKMQTRQPHSDSEENHRVS